MKCSNSCLLLVLVFMLKSSYAHKDGAPAKACLTMMPGHEGTSPQPLETAPHRLDFAPAPSLRSSGSNDSTIVIVATLTSKNNVPFKGFFVQARSTTNGDVNPVGMWDVSGAAGLAKGVTCGGVKNSAVTHVDSSPKPSVTLLWSMDKTAAGGKVVFVATVVQEYRTYWVGVQSDVLNLDMAANIAATTTGTTMFDFGSSSSMRSDVNNNNNNNSSLPHPLVPSADSQQQHARSASSHSLIGHNKSNNNDTLPHAKKSGKSGSIRLAPELAITGLCIMLLLLLQL